MYTHVDTKKVDCKYFLIKVHIDDLYTVGNKRENLFLLMSGTQPN
jgi:hypothetical protein